MEWVSYLDNSSFEDIISAGRSTASNGRFGELFSYVLTFLRDTKTLKKATFDLAEYDPVKKRHIGTYVLEVELQRNKRTGGGIYIAKVRDGQRIVHEHTAGSMEDIVKEFGWDIDESVSSFNIKAQSISKRRLGYNIKIEFTSVQLELDQYIRI